MSNLPQDQSLTEAVKNLTSSPVNTVIRVEHQDQSESSVVRNHYDSDEADETQEDSEIRRMEAEFQRRVKERRLSAARKLTRQNRLVTFALTDKEQTTTPSPTEVIVPVVQTHVQLVIEENKDIEQDVEDDVPSGESTDDEKQSRVPTMFRKRAPRRIRTRTNRKEREATTQEIELLQPRERTDFPRIVFNEWLLAAVVTLMGLLIVFMVVSSIKLVTFTSGLLVMSLILVLLIAALIYNQVSDMTRGARQLKLLWENSTASRENKMLAYCKNAQSTLKTVLLLFLSVPAVVITLFVTLPELALDSEVLDSIRSAPSANQGMLWTMLVFGIVSLLFMVCWMIYLLLFVRDFIDRQSEIYLEEIGVSRMHRNELQEIVTAELTRQVMQASTQINSTNTRK